MEVVLGQASQDYTEDTFNKRNVFVQSFVRESTQATPAHQPSLWRSESTRALDTPVHVV